MRAIKTTTISILAVGLLAGSAVGVAAQDEEFPPLVYFTGSAGDPGRVVEPEVTPGDLGWTMSGLELHDIPFEMSDPRISGLLSGFGQGAGGGPFGEEGFVNFDAYAVRIDNEGGSWEGQGHYFWVALAEDDEQIDTSTMLFTGSGDYEGLYAYVVVDSLEEPNVRGIITSLEPAAFPEPVPAPAGAGSGESSAPVTVVVPGTDQWTDTGIDLRIDDTVSIEAAGEITPRAADVPLHGPDGVPDGIGRRFNLEGLEEANHNSLIGRIGVDGAPFQVGSQLQSKADTDGRLFLGVNDVDVANNAGEFTATVTVNP